jgi:hypothetical protein
MSTTIWAEPCAQCRHVQAWHIKVSKGYLEGHMIPCRFKDCDCPKWQPTWGEGREKVG